MVSFLLWSPTSWHLILMSNNTELTKQTIRPDISCLRKLVILQNFRCTPDRIGSWAPWEIWYSPVSAMWLKPKSATLMTYRSPCVDTCRRVNNFKASEVPGGFCKLSHSVKHFRTDRAQSQQTEMTVTCKWFIPLATSLNIDRTSGPETAFFRINPSKPVWALLDSMLHTLTSKWEGIPWRCKLDLLQFQASDTRLDAGEVSLKNEWIPYDSWKTTACFCLPFQMFRPLLYHLISSWFVWPHKKLGWKMIVSTTTSAPLHFALYVTPNSPAEMSDPVVRSDGNHLCQVPRPISGLQTEWRCC